MKKNIIWIIWLIFSTLGLLGFTKNMLSKEADRSLFLPGETTHAHHQIEMDCSACHTPQMGVKQDACLDCHAKDLEAIVPAVQDMGKRHVDYGVKESHYGTVGEALLWTLEQGLGDGFTDETKEAWTAVYTVLSTTMIESAKTVNNEPKDAPQAEGSFFSKLISKFFK